MASSAGYVKKGTGVLASVAAAAMAFAAYKSDTSKLEEIAKSVLTGPGSKSRMVAIAVILFNWKSLPFAWTIRVWHAVISHVVLHPPHSHPPGSTLFRPVAVTSHVTGAEVDYNIHKSNSTYFADLDVSRTHLCTHLFAKGIRELSKNSQTGLVKDPKDPSLPAKGKMGIMLGAVQCSFRREIKPYQKFEMWSRVLGWDRKWLYMVTYFVERGTKPGAPKKIFASSMSKYVVKMGRLTVHPAVMIEASGLLPERPGGWVGVDASSSDGSSSNGTGNSSDSEEGVIVDEEKTMAAGDEATGETEKEKGWDWRRTELERKKGLKFVESFAKLDEVVDVFPDETEEEPLYF